MGDHEVLIYSQNSTGSSKAINFIQREENFFPMPLGAQWSDILSVEILTFLLSLHYNVALKCHVLMQEN